MNPNWIGTMAEAKRRDDEAKAAPPAQQRGQREMFTKPEVNFQHPAKGEDHCGSCVHYRGGDRCEIVIGIVKRDDWCSRWKERI